MDGPNSRKVGGLPDWGWYGVRRLDRDRSGSGTLGL
eukprot:COSAG04_NODE_11169_length_725_cov_1.122807_1_plen_35_part_01